MKDHKEDVGWNLQEILLAIPYIQEYEMIDWVVLVVAMLCLIMTIKGTSWKPLFVFSNVLIGFYHLSCDDLGKGILFLVCMALVSFDHKILKKIPT